MTLLAPTITELARQGKRRGRGARLPLSGLIVDLKGRDPEEATGAIRFVCAMKDALRLLDQLDLEVVPLLQPGDRARR